MQVRKVLHVIPSVSLQRGGPSQLIRTIGVSLCEAGIETHVATTDDDGRGVLDVPCGVPICENGVTYWFFHRQTRFYTFSSALGSWLARHVADYDLVHIHALFSYSSVAAAYWARRRGLPYIVRPLGTLNRWGMQKRRPILKNLSFRLIESRILRGAAAVHYTSDQERQEALALGVTARAEIIPNALEVRAGTWKIGDFRARYPMTADRPIVLFMSRFDAKKGLDMLLPAFVQVRAQLPEAILVLAGSGDQGFVNRLEQDCNRLGLETDVLWAGFLTGEDKRAALADADVFVLPSYSENFGIAAIEAMDAGVPVIISDQVGIHREVSDAKAGVVIPCDVARLADAILRLLRNPRECAELSKNGQSLVQQRYSLRAVTAQIIRLYEQVAKEPVSNAAECVQSSLGA